MAVSSPKSESIKLEVSRMNKYLAKNPTCSLKEASEILGFNYARVRKWKEKGWIDHVSGIDIVNHLGISSETTNKKNKLIKEARKVIENKNKEPEKSINTVLEKINPSINKEVSEPSKTKDNAVSSSLDAENIADLLEIGKKMSISEIRALIKQRLVAHIDDAKCVSNYAAALKAMAGVQDVELEDVYINENLIKIYVPEQKPMPKLEEILEVEPFEL